MSIAAETSLWPLAVVLPRVLAAEDEDEDGQEGGDAERSAKALALGERWQEELDDCTAAWLRRVSPEQYAEAEDMIRVAVEDGDVEALAALTVPVLGDDLLLDHMTTMYGEGADFVVAEAADQGVKIKPAKPAALLPAWQPMNAGVRTTLASWALAIAMRIGARTAAGLSAEAQRLYRPGATAQQVVDGVREYWDGLTDAVPREAIGGGLSRACNLGKLDTYAIAKPRGWRLELIADERLDKSTCGPCRKINGEVLPSVDAAALAYGGAGYLYCEGRERCRGTVRGVWTNKKAGNDIDLGTLLHNMKGL